MFLVPLFDLKFLTRSRRKRCRNFKSAALMAAVGVISGSNIPEQVQKVRLDSPLAWPGRGFDRDRPSGLITGQGECQGSSRNLSAQAGTGPVAERGLHQGKRRDRRGVGAQDPRPQGKPQDSRLSQQDNTLFLGEPTFGADQDVDAV
jgi:hypothetical protein